VVRQISTTGKISLYQKPKSPARLILSRPARGALAIATNVGRDAVDAECVKRLRMTRTVKACGPDVAVLASMLLGDVRFPRALRRQKSCSPGRARHKP
jgi:hypothetical protein